MRLSDFVAAQNAELSEITGIDKAHWSRIDAGQSVTEKTINKIAEALELSPDAVLRGINERRERSCGKRQQSIAS